VRDWVSGSGESGSFAGGYIWVMTGATARLSLSPMCARRVNARDAHFGGIFVGIHHPDLCRPVCPARVSYHDRRRFFDTAASMTGGFRPCLLPRAAPAGADRYGAQFARVAAHRMPPRAQRARGGIRRRARRGDRHLRRVLDAGSASPAGLAQTTAAPRQALLADTTLPVTGRLCQRLQSLRFNSVFGSTTG
jgi:methylphosphotriester-DNA--protein-cysteine methyltransferase